MQCTEERGLRKRWGVCAGGGGGGQDYQCQKKEGGWLVGRVEWRRKEGKRTFIDFASSPVTFKNCSKLMS